MSEEKLIPADKATVLLLDKMLEELRNVKAQGEETLAKIKEQTPEGVTEPIEPITVTSIIRRVLPTKPLFNVSIVNDGPDNVQALVNPEKSFEWHTITKDETYRVDMGRPIITEILLRCNINETANIRLVGSR